MKDYEIIEHTADIGIRVRGKDLKDLFKNAAAAMFDIISGEQITKAKSKEKLKIKQEADDLEQLFVNWLNELLSLSAVKKLIFSDFQIKKLDERTLQATVVGGEIKNYKLKTEIKAATYHQLKLEKSAVGWQTEVIFDV